MAWESVPGNSAGSMNGDGSRKLLLHDTEGSTIAGALAAYRAKNSWPTLTVDANSRRGRRVVRHLPDTVAARSLQNRDGGADETNKDGSVHIQIEIVGFVNNRDGSMFSSRDDYVWFGTEVVGPLCRRNDIPLTSSVRWVPYDASYGLNAPQRLSVAAWDAYSGILGHQHAPDNSHGDPGDIDIDLILSAARGDDDMSKETVAEGVELALAPGGRARDEAKTLIIGSLVTGLRKPREGTKPAPGEGDLRGLFKDLVNEVLDDRLGPAEPPAPSVPPTG